MPLKFLNWPWSYLIKPLILLHNKGNGCLRKLVFNLQAKVDLFGLVHQFLEINGCFHQFIMKRGTEKYKTCERVWQRFKGLGWKDKQQLLSSYFTKLVWSHTTLTLWYFPFSHSVKHFYTISVFITSHWQRCSEKYKSLIKSWDEETFLSHRWKNGAVRWVSLICCQQKPFVLRFLFISFACFLFHTRVANFIFFRLKVRTYYILPLLCVLLFSRHFCLFLFNFYFQNLEFGAKRRFWRPTVFAGL